MSIRLVALTAALLAGAALPASAQDPGPTGPMLGFTGASGAAERALERRFDAAISPQDEDGWLLRMASQPNQVGSPHDRDNAEWQLAQFRSWGWDAHIESFQVLYPTPITVSLDLLGAQPFHARLHEPAIPQDRTS